MAWAFKREENTFTPIPEGRYRIRIKSAEKAISKSGKDMLALQFEVSGSSQILYHYIVFLDDRPEITNRMLTQFFDAFPAIPEGSFDMRTWIGKVGACQVKHEEYNGNPTARISYFIHKDKQGDLPKWKDANGVSVDENGFLDIPEGTGDDIPFD